MSLKKIFLSVLLLSLLTAATAGYHWWKGSDRAVISPAAPREMPPVAEEFQKLMRSYRRAADTLASVAGTIRIYDQENNSALKETRAFRFVRCGAGYFMQLSSLQAFCDGKWLVQLDTANRQIAVSKAPAGGPDEMMTMVAPPERLFSDTARFRIRGLVEPEEGGRSLRLESELNPEIRSSTMFYDTASYQLNKAVIEWWKPGTALDDRGDKIWLVKIDYRYPPAEKIKIREKIRSIVSIDARGVTPAAAYRDYNVNANNN